MVEHSLQNLMLRGSNQTTLRQGRLASNVTSLHAGYELNDQLTLLAGGRYGYQPDHSMGSTLSDAERGGWLEAGLQFRDVPVVVSWRPEDNAVSFGVVIPFGR